MGIYDREYYRREGPSFLEAITNTGKVCKWLILINVVAFVVQTVTMPTQPSFIFLGDIPIPSAGPFTDTLDLNTDALLHGQVWRLLTAAFLHGGLWHIVFNMLFLWWFGRDVEEIYGHREFLTFYLISAVVSSLAFFLYHVATRQPAFGYGASGAVTAVLVLCALHFPTRTILLMFVIPVPIWLFVIFQVAQDTLGLLSNAPGVGFSAHLGGAAFGFLYFKFQWRMMNLLPDLRGWLRQRSRPRLKVYREEADSRAKVPVAARTGREVDEHLEAKVDAVLEKVARSGKDSLTESEKELLLRASEIYKKKRS